MSEEMCIEVDENDNEIGLRPKSDFYTAKYIHRSVNLLLFNSEGKLLIHKRTATKKWYPNLYTYSVSGTVGNETCEECMKHEITEEIGISVPIKAIFKYYSIDDVDKAVKTIFIAKSDDKIVPDPREIAEIKWVSLEELKEDVNSHPEKYTPPFVKGIKIFFEEHMDKIPK